MNTMPSRGETPVRSFVAVLVPTEIQQRIVDGVADARHRFPEKSVRWVRAENIHLTLRFIGHVVLQDIEALKAAIQKSVEGIGPVALQPSAVGCFPHEGAARVLWMGLAGELERLSRLQRQVVEGTRGWGRVKEGDFHPHLTLGRVITRRRENLLRIAESIHAVLVPRSAPWQVDAVHLVESVPAPGGSVYSTLASFPLADRR